LALSYDLNYKELGKFADNLLNLRHPDWESSPEIAETLLAKLKQESAFKLKFPQDDVFLFTRVLSN
jgi:uncharacterized protein YihD (DUF1040 family)